MNLGKTKVVVSGAEGNVTVSKIECGICGKRVMANRPFYSCVLSCRPLNESETGVDLVLIETSLLFLC